MITPSAIADRVLAELGVIDPSDLHALESIAWARGALVRSAPLKGAEARLTGIGRRAIITVSTQVDNQQRRRFCIAHELGHLEMRHRGAALSVCSTRDLDTWGKPSVEPSIELLSNEFAAALLLPRQFFADRCTDEDPSLERISELAGAFDVSLTATAIRYVRFCEEPIAIVYSQDGFIKWFRGSAEFSDLEVHIPVGDCLHSESLADGIFSGTSHRRSARRGPASAWLTEGSISEDARLLEQSWGMPRFKGVITLLWVDSELWEDSDN